MTFLNQTMCSIFPIIKHRYLRPIVVVILLTLFISAKARIYLVSVGVADYSGYPARLSSLQLTAKDAETIADLYSKNTSVDYVLLLNDKATKNRILKSIEKLFSRAKEDDIVIFFFSGHGYDGGLCAYDGHLGYDKIRKSISLSKCKNKMMFVDACRSGGMRINRTDTSNDISQSRKSNVMLFLASRTNENSMERRDLQNGFFTYYLQKGLKGEADINNDKIVTAKELFKFVYEGVGKISDGKQHPVMWGNFNDNMPIIRW